MLEEILREREYPSVIKMADGTPVTSESWEARRREMLELLSAHSYGRTPTEPVSVSCRRTGSGRCTCAGKCVEELWELTYTTPRGVGSFPFQLFLPTEREKPPVLLHLSFGEAPSRSVPTEEIIDHGYALVVVDYKQMVNDNLHGDYSDGIAAHFGTSMPRRSDEWGKIGMWAWGASRVLDYLIAERRDLDTDHVVLTGHSRTGKTALWCAAQDPRFFAVAANNSGYGGAASSKHGKGERVKSFVNAGSWDWYCEDFKSYADEREDEKPYDQSFLLALIAPRYLMIGSAERDPGADPEAEFLTTLHASAAWELLGERGLVTKDEMPLPGAFLGEGKILYHYRRGTHYLSREDWCAYIRFLDEKLGKCQ